MSTIPILFKTLRIHRDDALKPSSTSTPPLNPNAFYFMYAQFRPSLSFTYNLSLALINSTIYPSVFGKVEDLNFLEFMLSSYSPSLSCFTHCLKLDSATSLHYLLPSALRKSGTHLYLLFAPLSMYFLALSDCKPQVYEARLVFGIVEQEI